MSDGRAAAARYDGIAQGLHWLVGALAVIVVAIGLAATAAPRQSATRDALLLLHRSVGLTILLAMLLRLAWRLSHPPPPLPADVGRLERILARIDHYLLYALLIAMPIAGYLNSAAAQHTVSLFGLAAIPPLIAENGRLAQWAIAFHLAAQYVLYALVALHVAGALYHALLRRDGVFQRMLPRRL